VHGFGFYVAPTHPAAAEKNISAKRQVYQARTAMMISGFEWERNIARANMGAGITTQVRRYCQDTLIPKLEERRFWVETFNVLNAPSDPLLQQSLESVHFFERLARKWKFVRDAKKKVWRLYFVAMIAPPPEADVDAIVPGAGEDGPEGGVNQRLMRPDDGPPDVAAARAADAPSPRGAREMLHEIYLFYAHSGLKRLRRTLRATSLMAQDALERVEDDLNHIYASLRLRRAKVAESLTAMVSDMRMVAACAPRKLAQLEFVRVRLGSNQTMELSQYRSEEPDWNSWLFGRPLDEEFVLQ
jgi:hypothetical protein